MPFYPADWIRDTRVLTLEQRGAWIDIICILWESPTRGKASMMLSDWGQCLGLTEAEADLVIREIKRKNIANVTFNKIKITVSSRRIVRDEYSRLENNKSQRRFREKGGGNPDKWIAIRVKILQRDAYMCGYCGRRANTVDHIVPRSLGGDESESNLVACCKKCNMEKSNRTMEQCGFIFWNKDQNKTKIIASKDQNKTDIAVSDVIRQNHKQQLQKQRIVDVAVHPRPKFCKPSIPEIEAYTTSIGYRLSAQKFFDHYESNGWRVGKNPMKDWKAAVRTWRHLDAGPPNGKPLEPENSKWLKSGLTNCHDVRPVRDVTGKIICPTCKEIQSSVHF